MRRALLDTDTLSYYMENRPEVVTHAASYLREFGKLDFSVVSYYEVRRGLLHAGATRKLDRFEQFASDSSVWELDLVAAADAADICADLWRRGLPIEDADILIASIARSHGLVLVTNNTAHYERVGGLEIDNWTLG